MVKMKTLAKNSSIAPYVKDIYFIENADRRSFTQLPFYADGFPGMVYSKSEKGFLLHPRNKKVSNFYVYGQTITPISLAVKGSFQLLVFKLYPFAVRLLLGIDPKELNDDCYDLHKMKSIDTSEIVPTINAEIAIDKKVTIISDYLLQLVAIASKNADARIKLATNLIIKSKGQLKIKDVRDQLFITERTFERHFFKEIGVTPKQFSKIIQFSTSLDQITEADYYTLTEISYDAGFADQSHFIRTFKKFTGKTPKEFQTQRPTS